MVKNINRLHHIIIPKKWDTGSKSQELLENLNSVSTDDIKAVWGELEVLVEENKSRKEILRQQNLEHSQKNEEKRIQKEKEEIEDRENEIMERFDKLSKSPEGLKQLHKEIDRKICKRIYKTINGFRWNSEEIWYELEKILMSKNNLRPCDLATAILPKKDWKVYLYIHSNYWTDYPSWVRWKYIIWINVNYNDELDTYEVAAPNWIDDSNIDWESENTLRDWPVTILHSYSDSLFDSGNRSKELLQEKFKLLDNNIFDEID